MESVDPASGQIVGFDVDVVNAICAKINCQAEFVTTGWDGIFAALDQGSFDLAASGVSITDERKKAMDFSDPYIVNSQAVLTRAEDQGITLEKFKAEGRKLSAQANTTDAQVAEGVVGKPMTRSAPPSSRSRRSSQTGSIRSSPPSSSWASRRAS